MSTTTTTMSKKSFPFIMVQGPKVDDPKARRIIRKQAMKDVGEARKKRGNYGRVNMRQLPQFEDTDFQMRPVRSDSSPDSLDRLGLTKDGSSDSAGDDTDPTDFDEEVLSTTALARKGVPVASLHEGNSMSLAAINLFSSYETARAKFCIDLADLSILTNFNVGKSTIPILSADPTRLAGILGQKQWSYLQFVPSLYGSSEVITAATNCLLGKAKAVLLPSQSCRELTLRLYAKALRSLQTAIQNQELCAGADVLCATQLLSLHELLDASRDTAWSHHISGSARLIRHRTPQRFVSEFEKALFAAHVGPIVSECLVGNTACYLEEKEWSALYRSLILESDFLHDRSALTINARLLMFPLPGLWHDVGEAITGPELYDDYFLSQLEQRCRTAHRNFIDWMEDYKAHCVRLSLAAPPPRELALRRELFGSALECLAIIKRLLATVCDQQRMSLEKETQALAHLILDLQKQPSPKHSWLFSGHEVGVAYTVMLTRDQWDGWYEYSSDEERRMAVRTRYNTWSNTLRMTG